MMCRAVLAAALIAIAAPAVAAPASKAATKAATKPAPAFAREWLQPFFATGAARKAAESFRQEQWEGAETGLLKASASLPAKSGERAAARYLAALAIANQGKWADAAAIFEELHASYPRLGPYHAYN